MDLEERYRQLRQRTQDICSGLKPEDYVVQPVVDVSPPKWHLGHTSWFFETFLLLPYLENYALFDPDYNFVFNSYYEAVGARVIRTDRGNLSRPSVDEVLRYRDYVDEAMLRFLSRTADLTPEIRDIIMLGCNHEEQHQELLITDIKFILGNNPLLPAYPTDYEKPAIPDITGNDWIGIPEGIYEIGAAGDSFCFDNELNGHKVYLHSYKLQSELVTNEQFIAFIKAGGYSDFRHWHSDGWEWVKTNQIKAPLYWQEIEGVWYHYTSEGLCLVPLKKPVCHISYYEAWAFAGWSGCRLPTEAEWGNSQRTVSLGSPLGMDRKRLPALSRLQKSGRGNRRIQWQIHDQSDGIAWRLRSHQTGTQPEHLPQFFSTGIKMAVYWLTSCPILITYYIHETNNHKNR